MKDTLYSSKTILSYALMVIGIIVAVVSILAILIILSLNPDPYARGALGMSIIVLIPLAGGFLAGLVMVLIGYFLKPSKVTSIDTAQQK